MIATVHFHKLNDATDAVDAVALQVGDEKDPLAILTQAREHLIKCEAAVKGAVNARRYADALTAVLVEISEY